MLFLDLLCFVCVVVMSEFAWLPLFEFVAYVFFGTCCNLTLVGFYAGAPVLLVPGSALVPWVLLRRRLVVQLPPYI